VERGYGERAVEKHVRDGLGMKRQEALKRAIKRNEDKRVNFVITHSSYLTNIKQLLGRHEHYLREDRLEESIGEVSLRRGKNPSDLIVNAKARKKNSGSGPCGGGCALCER
jgi:gluconate kinase